jgi:mRNA-degrading endonuclease RelE of RelBE toxin-antitoxin system
MITFEFSKYSKKKFLSLPKSLQKRVEIKLVSLKKHDDIFSVLKRLHHYEPATHRLRVGSFRLILKLERQEKEDVDFLVLDLGDRKEIYK